MRAMCVNSNPRGPPTHCTVGLKGGRLFDRFEVLYSRTGNLKLFRITFLEHMKVESYIRILFGGARSRFCRNINTMSPSLSDTSLRVGRVAVIGAGPCGLAAAKYGTYAQTTLRVTGISANENQVSKGRKEVLKNRGLRATILGRGSLELHVSKRPR